MDEPDIEIGAVVRAKRLRFNKKPETEIRFEGEPDVDSSSGSERKNLPEPVEPGKTYRDVLIGWRATAKLDQKDQDENSQ
jgi:hypothetical protein